MTTGDDWRSWAAGFLRARRDAAWMETDHPRGKGGKFAEKPGLAAVRRGLDGPDREPRELVELTKPQRTAVSRYTNSGFTAINDLLRGSKSPVDNDSDRDATIESIDGLRGAMSHYKLTEDTKVFRSVNMAALGITDVDSAKDTLGKTWREDGFLSTSVHQSSSLFGNLDLVIIVPKGTHYLDTRTVSPYSAQNDAWSRMWGNKNDAPTWENPTSDNEEEWLLPDGMELTVVEVQWPEGSGVRPRLVMMARATDKQPSVAELDARARAMGDDYDPPPPPEPPPVEDFPVYDGPVVDGPASELPVGTRVRDDYDANKQGTVVRSPLVFTTGGSVYPDMVGVDWGDGEIHPLHASAVRKLRDQQD